MLKARRCLVGIGLFALSLALVAAFRGRIRREPLVANRGSAVDARAVTQAGHAQLRRLDIAYFLNMTVEKGGIQVREDKGR